MNKTLANHINRMLTPLGFLKMGTTWRRNHKVAFDVVGIQLAQFSTGVTVAVGVYFKNLGNETNPIVEMCHIRKTLTGSSDDCDLDRYAQEFDDSDFQVDQFVAALTKDGLPWFDFVKTKGAYRSEGGNGPIWA